MGTTLTWSRFPSSPSDTTAPTGDIAVATLIHFPSCAAKECFCHVAVDPTRLAVLQGVMAMTRRGLPEPPTIFSGAAMTMAPVGGS